MARRLLTTLVLASLVGCGSNEPPVTPFREGPGAVAVPPAQMRMILDGMTSDHPGKQYAALETLSRFPSVVETRREHVERLQKEGQSQPVRQKAAELLAALEQ